MPLPLIAKFVGKAAKLGITMREAKKKQREERERLKKRGQENQRRRVKYLKED